MKKIGIITVHRALNYGAVLQAYALREAMGSFSDCEMIDYECKHIKNVYKLIKLKSLKGLIASVLTFPRNYAKKRKFHRFLTLMNLSPYVAKEKLGDFSKRYDSIVTGSDQVFNYQISESDWTYMLDFVSTPVKKYSYAASFGFSELDAEHVDKYKELLSDYEEISVREKKGIDILEKQLGLKGRVSIDPTLLLDPAKWETLAMSVRNPIRNKRYVLIYMVATSEGLLKRAKEYADQRGLEVFIIGSAIRKLAGYNYISGVGPEEFVRLIRDSDAVFTTSFHGTAFSLIFKKPFYSFILSNATRNSRIIGLLESLNMTNRLIVDDEELKPISSDEYSYANQILEDSRNRDREYLKEIAIDE